MALFYLLLTLKEELGIKRLGVAHVNHGLRGEESDADAQFVKAVAAKTDVPFHETILSPRHKKSGMELWARKARYDFFKKLMASEGYACVATGHTANDQAETALMRIMRGCGLKGLCAIEPVRRDGIIRPLLYIKRADLRAWLAATGVEFREDSSNNALEYSRNRVRLETLPKLEIQEPGITDVLIGIARNAYQAWTRFEPHINLWTAESVLQRNAHEFSIKKASFAAILSKEEALAQVLREKGIEFQQCHVDALTSVLSKTNKTILLCGGWRCISARDHVTFYKDSKKNSKPEETNLQKPFSCAVSVPGKSECPHNRAFFIADLIFKSDSAALPLSTDNLTVFLDARKAGASLVFRNVEKNDSFIPLGSRGQRNVRDYLKKQKKADTVQGLVAKKGGEIVWIPGVQISQTMRVTPQTREILKISYTGI